MAIDFPASPTIGQTYLFNGITYQFSAQGVWTVVSGVSTILGQNIQLFTASGTYTPTAGMKYCVIECIGGGGGGGGAGPAASGLVQGGGGGGSGGYSKKIVNAATIGASKAVTIGNGGTAGTAAGGTGGNGGQTSVSGLCTANGGFGGIGTPNGCSAGNGASESTGVGDIVAGGNPGQNGSSGPTTFSINAGPGGSSALGGGGNAPPWSSTTSAVGGPGRAYGGGGAGAFCYDTLPQRAGGAGATGVVIITEYL